MDSDWYGLCFNLAQFALHFSWHVLGCVNIVLVFPDTFVRFSVLCGCKLHPQIETPRELPNCIRTVRKIEQLLCRSANLSFRPRIRLIHCRLKGRLKHETNEWNSCETRVQVLFTSCHVQINSRSALCYLFRLQKVLRVMSPAYTFAVMLILKMEFCSCSEYMFISVYMREAPVCIRFLCK